MLMQKDTFFNRFWFRQYHVVLYVLSSNAKVKKDPIKDQQSIGNTTKASLKILSIVFEKMPMKKDTLGNNSYIDVPMLSSAV